MINGITSMIAAAGLASVILVAGQSTQSNMDTDSEVFFNNFILQTEDNPNVVIIENQDDPFSVNSFLTAQNEDTSSYFTEDGRVDVPEEKSSGVTSLSDAEEKILFKNKAQKDKADGGKYFTENKSLTDKPDSSKYFTQNKKFIDKPDSVQLTQKPDPCLREDGSLYTGPGTVQNPFADGDPCLQPIQVAADDVAQGLRGDDFDPCLDTLGNPINTVGLSADDPCNLTSFATADDTAAAFAGLTEVPSTVPVTDTPPETIPPTIGTPPTFIPPGPNPTVPPGFTPPTSDYRAQVI